MSIKPNKTLIGLFLIISLITFIIVVGYFLASKIIPDNKNMVVMYFDESVAGLNVGAPVVFKGVEIGKVAKIDLIADPETLDFRIPVFARIDNRKTDVDSFTSRRMVLNELIQKGLRARLITQSYLTGQLMIELEIIPDAPLQLKQNVTQYMEIPTVLSQLGKLSKGLQDLPLKESVTKFNEVMDKMNQDVLPNINKLVKNLDKLVNNNSKDTLRTLNNLNKTLSDISQAAKALRNFADYIERHPESLLKGKKGN